MKKPLELNEKSFHVLRCLFDESWIDTLDKDWEDMKRKVEEAMAGMTPEEMEAYIKSERRKIRNQARKVK